MLSQNKPHAFFSKYNFSKSFYQTNFFTKRSQSIYKNYPTIIPGHSGHLRPSPADFSNLTHFQIWQIPVVFGIPLKNVFWNYAYMTASKYEFYGDLRWRPEPKGLCILTQKSLWIIIVSTHLQILVRVVTTTCLFLSSTSRGGPQPPAAPTCEIALTVREN